MFCRTHILRQLVRVESDTIDEINKFYSQFHKVYSESDSMPITTSNMKKDYDNLGENITKLKYESDKQKDNTHQK